MFHDSAVVLGGGAMICALGVLDDLFELDALTKLGGQVLAAGFLVLNQVQYFSFQLPGAQPVQPRPARRRRCSAWSWWSPP